MSGHSDELTVGREAVPGRGSALLQKPFTAAELLAKVRAVLQALPQD